MRNVFSNWRELAVHLPQASNWSELLDELRIQESLSSDAKLAESLGVTRGYICSVRKGRKNISLELAKKIISRLERTFDNEDLERLFLPVKVRQYTSNLNLIHRNVVSRAGGKCQLCGANAPFQDKQGHPYLEVHHIVPLTKGGRDTENNFVALCPNCHRKITINPTPEDTMKLERIKREYAEKS